MEQVEIDIIAIHIRLNELRTKMDKIMREEENFQNVKEIYLQIRELECYEHALQWNAYQNSHNEQQRLVEDINIPSKKHPPLPEEPGVS